MHAVLAEITAEETGSSVICPLSAPLSCQCLPLADPSSWPKDKGAQGCSLWRDQPPRMKDELVGGGVQMETK